MRMPCLHREHENIQHTDTPAIPETLNLQPSASSKPTLANTALGESLTIEQIQKRAAEERRLFWSHEFYTQTLTVSLSQDLSHFVDDVYNV